MARSPDWEKIPMAGGADKPAWPLPTVTPKFATWSLGGGRPFGCTTQTCERWHAGVDLTNAQNGALVIAPEDGMIAGLDKGWTDGTRAVFLRTDSGLFLVLGGVIAGSHKEFGVVHGQRVKKGDKLGRIAGGYGMLHLEAYKAEPARTANSRWWKDDPPPTGLLNPTNYIERMVGDNMSLLQTRQRLQALADLGFYKGDVGAAWGPAAVEALKAAQTALKIGVDGKWGPETEDAIQSALQAQPPCGSLEDCNSESVAEGSPSKSTDLFVSLKIIGGVVAGLTLAGVAAAFIMSSSQSR
ncbi:peptidoglycan-binding protein [Nannocystis sp. RBIL2]|uniref:peptidoglycan-binding protein n=1 Tax=Nannocystis sp. RBIL2 TaxID=2996788 RepID=UPI00227105A6|nr:peptidoglycan-binding protein [Nannocystis sp. RBIL2]MCY1065622.1 peptidoglycan-binding protein [Nannocystis sp. RBIL2]